MIKDMFYRCMRDEKGEITALRTFGYSKGNIGIHQEGSFWVATYIPTGMLITFSYKTKNNALKEALKLIIECRNFDEKIKNIKESEEYKKFDDSRFKQSTMTLRREQKGD